jgi:Outer membrane protein beta-barrel domain
MNRIARRLTLMGLLLFAASALWAQDESEDNPKFNTNLGLPLSAPLNPTGRFAGPGTGVIYGAGYNFTRRHSVMGEFMWDWLNPGSGGLTPIRLALQANNISGHSNLYALTGEYRFELRGKALGTYFIAGGGWYVRKSSLTKVVVTGSTITCTPEWIWWGASCTSGVVTANQTLASSSSSALGGNGGIGFTVRVGDAPYRIYVESRYHYAPTRHINTQLIVTTVGIRY